MNTHQNASDFGQPSLQKTSALGVIFFLFGAPHIYGALRQGAITAPERFTTARYVMVALIAAAIASIVEYSVLHSV